MGLFHAQNELGRQVKAKRAADKREKATIEKAKNAAIKAQDQHEENKKQGMI